MARLVRRWAPVLVLAILVAAGCVHRVPGASAGLHRAAASACTDKPAEPPKDAAPGSTYVNDQMPPERFRGNATAEVTTHGAEALNRICAPKPRPCGVVYYACTFGKHIDLPNPCDPQFKGERFALIYCHEQAHLPVNGWPASHGE